MAWPPKKCGQCKTKTMKSDSVFAWCTECSWTKRKETYRKRRGRHY